MAKSEFDKRIKELEKNFNIKRASDIVIEPKIRTGIFSLDYVLDGGIAQCEGGHKIEFYGRESSGKTTFALQVVKKFQSLGKNCVWINAENSYDTKWATKMGVDNEKLALVNPASLEDAGNVLIQLIPVCDLIVLDSIVALIPEEEIEKDFEDKTMASQAKVMSPICRKIYKTLGTNKPVIIFINQIREKVGVMYGNPETTAGGRALKHLYDSRVEFRLGKPIDVGTGVNKERVGNTICIKCEKNKKGKPKRTAEIDFYFGGEIDNVKNLFFSAVKYGIIKRAGAWFEYKEIREQGKESLINKLEDSDWEDIEKEIWERIK